MAREAIPKAVREKVLSEYNHLCAICGGTNPHLHHLDGDHANSDALNLLPLCPNHHLGDQHNPTRKMAPERMRLFRLHKDPAILWPQFEPLFNRLLFLIRLDETATDRETVERDVEDLVAFVAALEMGEFYSSRIGKLITAPAHAHVWSFDTPASEFERIHGEEHREHVEQLIANRDAVLSLAAELLRYQNWEQPASGI